MYFFQKQTYVRKQTYVAQNVSFFTVSITQIIVDSPQVLKILSDPVLDGQRVSRSSVHETVLSQTFCKKTGLSRNIKICIFY